MLTALPDATNDLTLPCHEQRTGAATAPKPITHNSLLASKILDRWGMQREIKKS